METGPDNPVNDHIKRPCEITGQKGLLRVETAIYRIITMVFFLIGRIPPETVEKMAGWLGRVWFMTDRRHREVAIENLRHVFGREKSPAAIRILARRVFCHLVLVVFEIGRMLHFRETDFLKNFRVSGLSHLRAAHKKGRGVLVLTGHMGNWELLVMCVAILGYPISAIYRPMDFKPLDRFFKDLRSRFGARMYAKKTAMRPILSGLRKKELIGILLDQNASARAGVFVDFFGKPASTNAGLALIALYTEAPVVPIFLIREGGRFVVTIGPEIPLIRTGDRAADVAANTRQYNQVLEEMIRRYPEQWFWVHRRWKTRPTGAAS